MVCYSDYYNKHLHAGHLSASGIYKFHILNPIQVCLQWKEIAHSMRDSEFQENEEHLIDVFDVKVCPNFCFELLWLILKQSQ